MGMNELLQILAATVGTLGFGIVFHVRGKKLFSVAFGGCLGWVLFLLFGFFIESEVVRYFIVSVIISLYGELMARLLKAPTTIYTIVCLVPFVPGSSLYYTMTSAFSGDMEGLLHNGSNTVKLAAALSLGVVIVGTTVVYIKKHFFHKNQAANKEQ